MDVWTPYFLVSKLFDFFYRKPHGVVLYTRSYTFHNVPKLYNREKKRIKTACLTMGMNAGYLQWHLPLRPVLGAAGLDPACTVHFQSSLQIPTFPQKPTLSPMSPSLRCPVRPWHSQAARNRSRCHQAHRHCHQAHRRCHQAHHRHRQDHRRHHHQPWRQHRA